MPSRKKKSLIKTNQKDIRSWVRDNRIVISEDKTNVSNIGKKISESCLELLKENKIIKNAFVNLSKDNVAEVLKAEIEQQIVENCDKSIWEHKRKSMKLYIEKRFYRLYDYRKKKLSLQQIRSIEDFYKFPDPRIIINVPFEEVTWDQFLYSNVISLTVLNIRSRNGPDFEVDEKLLLQHLESFYRNYLNNRGRKIPFRNFIEFYELKPGLSLDFKDFVPSEVRKTERKKINKFQTNNQIIVVADVHNPPATQQLTVVEKNKSTVVNDNHLEQQQSTSKKNDVVKRKAVESVQFESQQTVILEKNVKTQKLIGYKDLNAIENYVEETNKSTVVNDNHLEQPQQQSTSKKNDGVKGQAVESVQFESQPTVILENKVETRKFIGLEDFIANKKVVEYLENDMKKRFPDKYEEMKELDFDRYLAGLYNRYTINEKFYKRVSNWVNELKNENNFEKQKTTEISNLTDDEPIPETAGGSNILENIIDVNQIVNEQINDFVDEAFPEKANIVDGDVVIEDSQTVDEVIPEKAIAVNGDCSNTLEKIIDVNQIATEQINESVDEALTEKANIVDGDVAIKDKPTEEIITDYSQTVDEVIPKTAIDFDGDSDVLMKIVEDKSLNNIETVEEICPMQIDEISQNVEKFVTSPKKSVDKIDLMEIDEGSDDDVPIKIEQFSPYTDDVEEILIPENLPYTIEDSFNLNDCFDTYSEESVLGRKEIEAMNALDSHDFTVVPIPIKRTANIKETTGGNVISKHQYQQLNLNIKQRPYNTHKTSSQSNVIEPESLSQCIDNDVSQITPTPCIENNVSQAALLNIENSIFVDSQLLRKSNSEVIKKPIIIKNKLKQTKSLILAKLSKKSQGLLKKRKIIKKLRKRKPIDLSKINFLNDLFISSVKYGLNNLSYNSRKSKISMKIRSGLKTINLTHEEDIRIVTGLKRKEFCAFIDLIKKSENFEYNRFKNSDRIGISTIDKVLKLFLMTIPRFKSILLKLANNGEFDFGVVECTNSVQSILPTQNSSMVLDPYVRLSIENAKKCISDINC